MPHSRGLSKNPYLEPNQSNSFIDNYFFKIHSDVVFHRRLRLPKDHFPVGLPVKILKPLLPSSILTT